MDNLLLYLLKANVILVVIWACYALFLRKLSFHACKRTYLLLGLLFATIAPLFTWINYTDVYIDAPTQLVAPIAYTQNTAEPISAKDVTYITLLIVYALGFFIAFIGLMRSAFQLLKLHRQAKLIDAERHI